MGLHDIPAKGVVQLLEWELSINDNAYELFVAVLLLFGCWNVRANRDLSCLVLLGEAHLLPHQGPPSAPLEAEQGLCTAHHAAQLTGISCKG